jgi:hypothetical protein
MIPADRGLAALAAQVREWRMMYGIDAGTEEDESDAAFLLGDRAVFLPDGLPLTRKDLVGMPREEFRQYSDICHLADEQAATIADLRAALDGLVHVASRVDEAVDYFGRFTLMEPTPDLDIGDQDVSQRIVLHLRAALAAAQEADHGS